MTESIQEEIGGGKKASQAGKKIDEGGEGEPKIDGEERGVDEPVEMVVGAGKDMGSSSGGGQAREEDDTDGYYYSPEPNL